MYFENRRSGGDGQLKSWVFEPQNGFAIVEFRDMKSNCHLIHFCHSLGHFIFRQKLFLKQKPVSN